jgi:hypothetical protein
MTNCHIIKTKEKVMTFRGRVSNGVIILETSKSLPEGTEVIVRPVSGSLPRRRRPAKVAKGLLKLSGSAKGLPADASRNIDHYLYGHSKR